MQKFHPLTLANGGNEEDKYLDLGKSNLEEFAYLFLACPYAASLNL